MGAYVYLFPKVYDMALQIECKYKNTQNCKGDLLEFLDINDWFGMLQEGKGNDIMIQPNERWDKPSSWKVLDYIFSSVQDENEFNDEQIVDTLLAGSIEVLPIEAGRLLRDFLKTFCKGMLWEYHFDKRRIEPMQNEAYSIRDYSRMAYCVFNDQYREEYQLLQKACNDQRYANIWLFTALHFVCALRRTDIVAEWDYDRNEGIRPEEFSLNSQRRVWWKCKNGHHWRCIIQGRIQGRGCPYCAGKSPNSSKIL